VDVLKLRLLAVKSKQCATKKNKYHCPEVFLDAVADKLTTTADLFLDAELLSKFYYIVSFMDLPVLGALLLSTHKLTDCSSSHVSWMHASAVALHKKKSTALQRRTRRSSVILTWCAARNCWSTFSRRWRVYASWSKERSA